jgi:Enoyl-CoA hydratase/isomerase
MRCFEVEVEAKVAQVRLCRPDELNSMVPEFWSELPALIGRLSDDGGVRAVVLSSTGKHFSAGMDLGVFTAGGAGESGEPGRVNANRQLMVLRLQESFTALERARMPILAAIQGGCVGGAVDLVTACDMRYATEDAFFVVQETNIGMTADVGTLQRLPKIIPDGVARELVYTGRRRWAWSTSCSRTTPRCWPASPRSRPRSRPRVRSRCGATSRCSCTPATIRWPTAWPTSRPGRPARSSRPTWRKPLPPRSSGAHRSTRIFRPRQVLSVPDPVTG